MAQMTAEEIEAKVIQIIATQCEVDKDEISRETEYINDLNCDSLDLVELMMDFEDDEEGFGFRIPDEDVEKLLTVGQTINYIQERFAE